MRREPLAVALALDHDLVAGVGEPVECAVAEDRVVEEAEPLLDGAVRGDDEAGAAVAPDNQLVEVDRLLCAEPVQPEVVEDQQVGGEEVCGRPSRWSGRPLPAPARGSTGRRSRSGRCARSARRRSRAPGRGSSCRRRRGRRAGRARGVPVEEAQRAGGVEEALGGRGGPVPTSRSPRACRAARSRPGGGAVPAARGRGGSPRRRGRSAGSRRSRARRGGRGRCARAACRASGRA